jgi:hypothetical protein
MPRRQANVNQAEVQRIIRACQREKVPFRLTLQPNGAAVFEPATEADNNKSEAETSEDLSGIAVTRPPRSALPLPRYTERKPLKSGSWGYFFHVPSWARRPVAASRAARWAPTITPP